MSLLLLQFINDCLKIAQCAYVLNESDFSMQKNNRTWIQIEHDLLFTYLHETLHNTLKILKKGKHNNENGFLRLVRIGKRRSFGQSGQHVLGVSSRISEGILSTAGLWRVDRTVFVAHVIAEALLQSVRFVTHVTLVGLLLAVEDLHVTTHVANLKNRKCKNKLLRYFEKTLQLLNNESYKNFQMPKRKIKKKGKKITTKCCFKRIKHLRESAVTNRALVNVAGAFVT